jgi:hypothetical protein
VSPEFPEFSGEFFLMNFFYKGLNFKEAFDKEEESSPLTQTSLTRAHGQRELLYLAT